MEKKDNDVRVAITPHERELVIRTGAAEPVVPFREQSNITTTIGGPLEHITKLLELLQYQPKDGTNDGDGCTLDASYVAIDRDAMNIVFHESAGWPWQRQIVGELKFTARFQKWGINTANHWPPHKLADFIKMNRSDFEDVSVAMKLVSDLRNFTAKIDREIENRDDKRANVRAIKIQTVNSNLPDNFRLAIPVFKGENPINFEVEVAIDADTLNCSLVSPEINDWIAKTVDAVMDEQKEGIAKIAPTLRIFEW